MKSMSYGRSFLGCVCIYRGFERSKNGDEEIYGGEISVWNRSWAKEINHMLCSCMSTCACVCEKDLFQDIYQRIQKPLLESNTKCIHLNGNF